MPTMPLFTVKSPAIVSEPPGVTANLLVPFACNSKSFFSPEPVAVVVVFTKSEVYPAVPDWFIVGFNKTPVSIPDEDESVPRASSVADGAVVPIPTLPVPSYEMFELWVVH